MVAVLELDVLVVPLVEASDDELVDGVACVVVVPVVVLWSVVVCGCATSGVAVSSAVTAAIGTYRMAMVISVSSCSVLACVSVIASSATTCRRLTGASTVGSDGQTVRGERALIARS